MDALETVVVQLVEQSHLINSTLEPVNDSTILLASKLTETEEKLKGVAAELESKTQNMTSLMNQSEETAAKLKHDIDSKTAEVDSAQKEMQQLRDLNLECEKMLAEEKGSVKILGEKLREKDAHFFEYMQKIADLQKQVATLEDACEQIKNEKDTLSLTATDSESEVNILTEDVTNLKSQLRAFKTENEALNSEKKSSLEVKEKLIKEVVDLRNQLMDIESSLAKTSEDQMTCLRGKLKVEHEGRQSAETESGQLRIAKDQVVRDLDALVTKTEQDNIRHQQEMKQLRDTATLLEANQNRLTSELENKTKELLDVEANMAISENENQALTGEVGDMKEMCMKLKGEVEHGGETNKEMTRTLQEKEEMMGTLTATIEALKQNQNVMQNDKQTLWLECKRLKTELETTTTKCTEQESQICDLQKTMVNVVAEKEQDLQVERQVIVDLKQRELELQEKMKSASDRLVQFMDQPDGCESVSMVTADLGTQLEVTLKDKEATICELREEKSIIDAQLQKQMAECEKKTERCAELEKTAAKLTSEVDDCKKQVMAMLEQLDKVTVELSQVTSNAETKIKDVLDETKSSCNLKINELSAELELARAALVAKETKLQEVHETSEQQLSALKFQHSSEQMLHQSTLKVG